MADMLTEIALGLHAVHRVGQMMDDGELPPEAISIVKRNSCGKALQIARVPVGQAWLNVGPECARHAPTLPAGRQTSKRQAMYGFLSRLPVFL